MGRFVWSQLRHRFGRTAALLLGIVVATTSFTVLTATSRTSQLRTTATVGEHFRVAYDILVRPPGSQSAIEASSGTVEPNFLSGIYGGISPAQWRAVQAIPGVDIAAPIAMIGTAQPKVYLPVPIAPYLTGSPRQLFRVRTTWTSDRGLTRIPQPDSFVYVTANAIVDARQINDDGSTGAERLPDGSQVPCCKVVLRRDVPTDAFGPAARSGLSEYGQGGREPDRPPGATVTYAVPLLIAAVDPESEARLAHLDQAVVSGRYLRADDAATVPGVPVLVSSRSGVDSSVTTQVERMADPTSPLPLIDPAALPATLDGPGTPVGTTTVTSEQAYAQVLAGLSSDELRDVQRYQDVRAYWSSGPTTYGTVEGAPGLVPAATSNPPSTWASEFYGAGTEPVSMDNADTAFRALNPYPLKEGRSSGPRIDVVGTFDPARPPAFDPLADVDLGAYTPVSAAPADDAARQALGGRDLLPNGNVAGHLRQPPQLITTLDGLAPLYGSFFSGIKPTPAPISVIRVRVAGVVGPDAVSRERVNQVAQQIAVQTGLQVDLVVGSSTAPTLVRLPAGKFGRPELLLSEGWVKKNIAITILKAVNRKSLVLFVLILAVCALFVANGTSAAVRTRRTELGVLACLGWSRPRLYTAVLSEVLLVGAVAGAAGSLIAVPLGRSLGLQVSASRAALAVPAAVLLALLAGAVPAWRASRADPGAAVRPAVSTGRLSRSPHRVAGLALTNVLRTPGRSVLAALSLAVGAAALTLLVGITLAFRGVVVGSLLGDAVAVQVRGVDYIAVVATVALGVLAVADVLFLNLRERAGELATLRATGWSESALSRLVVTEGALLGLTGALVGAAVGLAGAAVFAGALPGRLLLVTALVLAGGTAVTALAALVPAQLLRRLPTAPLLAED
ncbi:MAG TPA: FtsX-like permease family protein [Mycobacteriales bacterium]|nr:FtsX-like permease family protein [Mycobacteriales bacterium]